MKKSSTQEQSSVDSSWLKSCFDKCYEKTRSLSDYKFSKNPDSPIVRKHVMVPKMKNKIKFARPWKLYLILNFPTQSRAIERLNFIAISPGTIIFVLSKPLKLVTCVSNGLEKYKF